MKFLNLEDLLHVFSSASMTFLVGGKFNGAHHTGWQLAGQATSVFHHPVIGWMSLVLGVCTPQMNLPGLMQSRPSHLFLFGPDW